MKNISKRTLFLSLFLVVMVMGGIYALLPIFIKAGKTSQEEKTTLSRCGGWDTFGEVVCGCSGKYKTSPCSQETVCDSGFYFCTKSCEKCTCYQGSSEKGVKIPCDGREQFFKP